MTEKKPDYNTAIVIGGDRWLSTPRSKMISRGLKIAESLEKMPLTIVRDIIVDIDIHGFLQRWAIIDPVRIKNNWQRNKELNNIHREIYLGFVRNENKLSPERLEHYDIRIGDTAIIDESIIGFPPLKVVKGKRTGNEKIFKMPVKCPDCGSKIAPTSYSSAYYCTGKACPGKIKTQLRAFSNLIHIDINHELVKELVDKRMVLESADLYFLKKKDLMRLNKMDEDSAQRVLDAIEKSRHRGYDTIIDALLKTNGTTIKIEEKLKKGGVVFPRKGDD